MASLYRKWRSRSFDDLIGQEHVVRTLRNAVKQQRVAHAYLFTGPRGTGKTSTARILAKAVNCLEPRDGNPCNQCAMCLATNEGRALDVVEIDAASHTGVDNVRELRERVAYAAGEGRYKVYIVDEVHRLSGAAFDAFLKTLEEPPPHVIFVFASTEPHKVPDTITSRCQRFDFRRIPPQETLLRLRHVAEQEGLRIRDEALQVIALYAEGSLRDALGLLDQVASYATETIEDFDVRTALGLADPSLVGRLTEHLLSGQTGEGLRAFHRFLDAGGDPRQLTRQFVEYWRALLLRVTGATEDALSVDPALVDFLSHHAAGLHQPEILAVLRALVDQEFSAKFNIPAALPFEVAYVQAGLSLGRAATATPPPVLRQEPQVNTAPEGRPLAPQSVESLVFSPPEETPDISRPEAPPAASPTVPGAGAGNASEVEILWPAVVGGMRARSPSLQAILRSGHVIKAENGEITIGFLHRFHQNQLVDPKKRKLLEEVVEEVMGRSYRVTCVLTTKEDIEAVKGAGSVAEDDGFIEDLSERLRAYHARELGNSHS